MTMLNRRYVLKKAVVAGGCVFTSSVLAKNGRNDGPIRLGVIADLHGGLAVDARARLDSFTVAMKQQDCHALIQMGDFAYPNAAHQEFADAFNAAHDCTLHVIGNHEFDYGLNRSDCYRAWNIKAGYYRRDVEGLRILVLDGNDKGSPTHRGGYPSYIGKQQQEWLEQELRNATKPVLVLSHQPLAGTSAINNAAEIQKLIAGYREKVVVCLNGHSHVDALLEVQGVTYVHINSASYYWVGGKTRMAYYTRPLFTTVTVNPATATVNISPCTSEWKGRSPKALGYFQSEGRPLESIITPQISHRRISYANESNR